jgi:hypothetical protein
MQSLNLVTDWTFWSQTAYLMRSYRSAACPSVEY